MSQINRTSQFKEHEGGFLGLTRIYNIAKAVNGGIDFGDSSQTAQGPGTAYSGNMNGQWVNLTTPAVANTTFTVSHNLNRIPSWYLFISDRAADVFGLPGTFGTWSTTSIFLQCSVASAVLRIFVS